MLLECMKSGAGDAKRNDYYLGFIRRAFSIADALRRDFLLEHTDCFEAKVWQRLQESQEINADVYVPFVEGLNGEVASLSDLLADPLASYVQLFDTVRVSAPWNATDSDAVYDYITNDEASEINRLTLIGAVGVALMFCFDKEKLSLLLRLVEGRNVKVSTRAIVMALYAYNQYEDRLPAYPAIANKFKTIAESEEFFPLIQCVQKAVIMASASPALAAMLEDKLPGRLESVHESIRQIPEGLEEGELEEYIEDHPELGKVRDTLINVVAEHLKLQELGVDVNYHSFVQIQERLPFFREAANWLCPFSFDHPVLFNTSTAARFLSVVANNKTCDTDRFSIFLSMASQLAEIRIVKQDADTLEETKVEGDDADALMEQIVEDIEQKEVSNIGNLQTISPEHLQQIVNSYVQDFVRYLNIYCADSNEDLLVVERKFRKLWQAPLFRHLFASEERKHELADHFFIARNFDEALPLYAGLEADADVERRLAFCYEETNRIPEAVEHYETALLFDPEDRRTRRHLIACYWQNGDYVRSCQHLEVVFEENPSDKQSLRRLAEAYVQINAWEKAKNLFAQLIYMDSRDNEARRGMAWCDMALGDYEVASGLYSMVLDNSNVQADDYLNAGHCALLQHDISVAMAYYQECLAALGQEAASPDFFSEDAEFLEKRGVDRMTQNLIIDLLNI